MIRKVTTVEDILEIKMEEVFGDRSLILVRRVGISEYHNYQEIIEELMEQQLLKAIEKLKE